MSMPSSHAIVGRQPELDRLRELVQRPVRPCIAFLEGEAGMGKTALLEAIVEEAAEAALVLRARPTEAEAESSFAALNDLLRPVIAELPRLAEPQRRALAAALLLEAASDPVDPRLVSLACLSLLEGLVGPVLLAIDDWQWLDAASVTVLSFVLRRLEPGGAKVIATVRSGAADEAVAGLVSALPVDQALELAVGPLDPATLARLLHARTGTRLSPPALARLHEACGGNPLMALELVRAPGGETATDLRRLLAHRVGALSAETRAALRLVAALAEPTLELIEGATGSTGGLEEALAAEVIVREGSRVRFSHPLIGAVVQERTPPGEWRAIHARLAELTERPEERARHLAAASDGPAEAVAAALEAAAGEAATRGATMAAADLAERAAELTPAADESLRVWRLLAAADATMIVGDGQRARSLLNEVLAREAAGPRRAEALHKLAYLVDDDSALRVAEEALGEASEEAALVADIAISASMFAVMGGGMPTALSHAEEALRRAESCGQPLLLSQALSTTAFLRHVTGGGLQRELLLRADALQREAASHAGDDTPLEVLGMQLYVEGEFAEARELLTSEREAARTRGYLEHESFALLLLAELEVRAGRWQLAEEYARQTLELSLGSDMWNAEAAGHWAVALVDAHFGRAEAARAAAETGRTKAEQIGDLAFATRCSHVLGFVALSLGDAQAAVRHLAPLRRNEERLGLSEPAMFCIAPDLAEALVLAGELDAAREVQAELEARGRALGRKWAVATALRCRGLIAAVEGRTDDALVDLQAAVARHADVQQPFDRARTLLVLGAAQRRAKQRAEGRVSLEAALAVFEELDAALWADRARAEIARLGGRRAPVTATS